MAIDKGAKSDTRQRRQFQNMDVEIASAATPPEGAMLYVPGAPSRGAVLKAATAAAEEQVAMTDRGRGELATRKAVQMGLSRYWMGV